LVRIAADPSRDPQSKLTYYSAAVRVPERELARLNGRRLLPGMPAEVFITTGQRTIASYLLKPLLDQMKRPLRERWRFSQHPPTGERAAVAPALLLAGRRGDKLVGTPRLRQLGAVPHELQRGIEAVIGHGVNRTEGNDSIAPTYRKLQVSARSMLAGLCRS
jgi:hypothetical protein